MAEKTMSVDRLEHIISVFGSFDENLRLIEDELSVRIYRQELRPVFRPATTKMSGTPSMRLTGSCRWPPRARISTPEASVISSGLCGKGHEDKIGELARDVICVTAKGKPVKAKTLGQKHYVEAIGKKTITLGIGPAGTGKTYLAVAAAVAAFRDKSVNRIILTRPAVEAGERLGFLPGDLQSKVDPYLRPLYDALFEMLGAETYQKYLGTRQHRGRAAGLHARPHAGRFLHHPRRGAEHLPGADEDVQLF